MKNKIPKKSKLKSKRLFTAPKSRNIKGRKIKIVEIGGLPERIRVEVDVPGQKIEGKDPELKIHDIIETFEPGRMIIIWENDLDLKRNARVPLLLHNQNIK